MKRITVGPWCDPPEVFGPRLKQIREARGFSQKRLAPSDQGFTAAYISRVENGERIPSLQVIEELAMRLNTTRRHLCWGIAPGIRDEIDKKLYLLTDKELQTLYDVTNIILDARIVAPATQLQIVAA